MKFWSATNPYTCRLLRRLDAVIWRFRGRNVYWATDGHLCERMPKGHGVELGSHFPDNWYIAAANMQNKHLWTRRILSL